MEFKFDANQDYQIHAVEAVADLFQGQQFVTPEINFFFGGELEAVSNRLDVDEQALLENLHAVQTRNNIPLDAGLGFIEAEVETAEGGKIGRFLNFSVEMETGTGKTYVYLRTALELYRRYGLRKFIIVVPSVAIREGVYKTLQVTERHFRELYDNTSYRYYVYDSANLAQVRQFAISEGVEFMIMTIDAFNKASNVIRQATDWLQGGIPIHFVQSARPVLILDEPQNMESERSIAALAALTPLFALRYSATHRNPYNLVYRLTPVSAYRQGLVKLIEVMSVVTEDDFNRPYFELRAIETKKKTITARLAVHKLLKSGAVQEAEITVRKGENLAEKTSRPEYGAYTVDEINPGAGVVIFENTEELRIGETRGADKVAIFENQIRYTVEEHFRKQRRLSADGVKVLSLFFIDRVANYVDDYGQPGIISQIFARVFDDLKQKYTEWGGLSADAVQAAYFRQSRKKSGEIVFEDSTTRENKKDEEAYNLIMRDKERLLSFDVPVCFVFSHSALREGWDNPNVFQICTLNQTVSEIKKRQEIGRGMRLAVNQIGDRIRERQINILTVIANESYERYVATLQQELQTEYGQEGLPPLPANARKRKTLKLRKEFTLRPEFQELWDRIKHKTRYAVTIDTAQLIEDVVHDLDQVIIKPPRIMVSKAQVQLDDGNVLEALPLTSGKTAMELTGRELPDILSVIAHLLEYTTPPVSLSRRTLLEIFRRITKKEHAIRNPHEFAKVASQLIKDKLAGQLVQGIQYEKINQWYEMTQFEAELEAWEDYLVPASRSLYDHVEYDSDVERRFALALERRDDVKLFIKLPNWFTVDTPVGKYNPDWAIVMEDRDEFGHVVGKPLLYLVRETKDTTHLTELHPDERRKVQCGAKHFDALSVNYRVVTDARDLPNGGIMP